MVVGDNYVMQEVNSGSLAHLDSGTTEFDFDIAVQVGLRNSIVLWGLFTTCAKLWLNTLGFVDCSFGAEPAQPDPNPNLNHPPYSYGAVGGAEIRAFSAKIE